MEDSNKKKLPKKTVLYRMIYEDIKSKILNQSYANDEQLPFERELCEIYSVDRVTVRKALELLVADGLIEKRPGLGSFVRSPAAGSGTGQGESHNILFVMSNNANSIKNNPSAFNSSLFHAIEHECRLKGYSLFYAVAEDQLTLNDIINGNSFAGILFVSYIPPHFLEQCVQLNLPAICINNRFANMVSIVPEDERGAYDAVKYLQGQGHQKIGILLGDRKYFSTLERLRGYSTAMFEEGIKMNPHFIMEGDWTFNRARKAVLNLLDTVPEKELPTALFCCSDMMAIGAVDAFKERDISIPAQVSIVGFDNIAQSEHVYPRLTTIAVDIKLMAEVAVDKIVAFCGKKETRSYLIHIPSSLVVRQSVQKI